MKSLTSVVGKGVQVKKMGGAKSKSQGVTYYAMEMKVGDRVE